MDSSLPLKVERKSNGQLIGSPPEEFMVRQEMFLNGAQVWLNLRCEDFLEVRDRFQQNSTAYAIREYLAGRPLTRYKPTTGEWKIIVQAVYYGLKAIHDSGYSPKGFSSSEIWISNGIVKLLDFSAMRKIDDIFNPERDFKRVLRLLKDWVQYDPPSNLPSEQAIEHFINE